jgi:hypothetical protein
MEIYSTHAEPQLISLNLTEQIIFAKIKIKNENSLRFISQYRKRKRMRSFQSPEFIDIQRPNFMEDFKHARSKFEELKFGG